MNKKLLTAICSILFTSLTLFGQKVKTETLNTFVFYKASLPQFNKYYHYKVEFFGEQETIQPLIIDTNLAFLPIKRVNDTTQKTELTIRIALRGNTTMEAVKDNKNKGYRALFSTFVMVTDTLGKVLFKEHLLPNEKAVYGSDVAHEAALEQVFEALESLRMCFQHKEQVELPLALFTSDKKSEWKELNDLSRDLLLKVPTIEPESYKRFLTPAVAYWDKNKTMKWAKSTTAQEAMNTNILTAQLMLGNYEEAEKLATNTNNTAIKKILQRQNSRLTVAKKVAAYPQDQEANHQHYFIEFTKKM